jgi:hypothetical protein
MKARKVKGLDADGALADNAERIVRARLDELQGFIPRALDPDEVVALHDMRIAAKRLRYILEVTAESCFGPYAETALKRTKELQDLLFERFLEMWTRLERDGFRARLQYAASERPVAITGHSHDGNSTRARGAVESPAAPR